jgi:hypothetical protein
MEPAIAAGGDPPRSPARAVFPRGGRQSARRWRWARLVDTGVRTSRCRFGEREPLVAEVGNDLQPPIEDFGVGGECQRAPDGRASGDVVDFEIKVQRRVTARPSELLPGSLGWAGRGTD